MDGSLITNEQQRREEEWEFYQDLERELAKIQYKPNCTFELWSDGPSHVVIMITMTTEDAYHPGRSTKVRAMEAMSMRGLYDHGQFRTDLFLMILQGAVRKLECHEVDEYLMYAGKRIVDPHPRGSA